MTFSRRAPALSRAVTTRGSARSASTEARQQEVQEPELVHPPPGPESPGIGGRRHRGRVTLEDEDLVTVVGQEHGRDQPTIPPPVTTMEAT
jgi:hypothetical protein